MKTAYLIKYSAFDLNNKLIESKSIKVKNKDTEFIAKVELERYLQRKLFGFNRLIIHSCEADLMASFESIFPWMRK